MKTARSELMFDKLRGRNGLMKSVLEKLRKYLKEFVTPFFYYFKNFSQFRLSFEMHKYNT